MPWSDLCWASRALDVYDNIIIVMCQKKKKKKEEEEKEKTVGLLGAK